MNIQWYPGHMTKAKRMMQEDIKLIDIVIELVDARIPLSSKNPDIDELAKNKYRLILLNKSDLADDAVTAKWEKYYSEKGFFVAKINARDGAGMKSINGIVQEACREKIERDRKKRYNQQTYKSDDCGNTKCWKVHIYQFIREKGMYKGWK